MRRLAADRPAPRSALTGLVLCLFGLGVSTYLTYEHYTGSKTLSCPDTGTINCLKVTTSQWSHIGPIPVAVFGLAFFVVMALLCLPWLWSMPDLDWLRLAGAVIGVLSVIYLVYVELFKVDAICLWCTSVHAASVLLLGSVLWTNGEVRSQ